MIAAFAERIKEINPDFITFGTLKTLQINLGNLRNLNCAHCHVSASAKGTKIMERAVMEKIAGLLSGRGELTLDITGGASDNNEPMTIDDLEEAAMEGREIQLSQHCYCCTAGEGSSCNGTLVTKFR